MRTLNPLLFVGRDRGLPPLAEMEPDRINRRSRREMWARAHMLGGKRFLTTEKTDYGTYTAMTVTNLQSLANDSTDAYACWQSARVDNRTTTKATDYKIQILLSTANTTPADQFAAYCYVVPWMYDGATWTPMANFGTTTRPTGSEGTASISEPNSMKGPIVLPYKIAQQPLDVGFFLAGLCGGVVPDGWSLAIRNTTGAAFSTGCVVAYRSIFYTNE